ncbi:hypothetical protein [Sphingobium sp. B2]|nr:hypothetical protein [Sphingobium sp. B2]
MPPPPEDPVPPCGLQTVSYTHLDVYKRQILRPGCGLSLIHI